MSSSNLSNPNDEQAKFLEVALNVVTKHSSFMRKCLDDNKLMDGLKHSSVMLSELRSQTLSPKNYYELYMAIFDQLRHMTTYLKEAHMHGIHDLADLYELVQYAGNIVPRLYLMITIGSVFMGIPDAPVKDIMKDMMEMARGIQHPIRGLFLRHFLSSMTKDYLPVGDQDGPQGNLSDSINFTLENFVEQNKLWVRLQHQGHSRDRSKRELERKELRTLVGTNLVRLSQLDGMNLELYKARILPDLLEQITNCKDLMAQEYLMEAIIQVFQDDFHLRTLTPFLASIANLHPNLSAKGIVISFIDRLAAYAAREAENENQVKVADEAVNEEADQDGENSTSPKSSSKEVRTHRGIPEDVKLFEILWKQVTDLIEARQEMHFDDITALLVSSANLALSCYPENLDYINQVLDFAKRKYTELKELNSAEVESTTVISNLLALLQAPIDQYEELLTVLKIDYYFELYSSQPLESRKALSFRLIQNLLKTETFLTNKAEVEGVLNLIAVVVKDDESKSSYSRMKARTVELDDKQIEELTSVARVLNLIQNPEPQIAIELLQSAYNVLSNCGHKIKYTMPSLVNSAILLLRHYAQLPEKGEDQLNVYRPIFGFLQFAISQISTGADCHDLAFRLYLSAALAADELQCEAQCYDYFVEAFTCYEEGISLSKAQNEAIVLLIGSLHQTRSFSADNYETLGTKCVQHAGQLLKKPDQCRAIAQAAKLFWVADPFPVPANHPGPGHQDGPRVLETLQRALKIADGVMDPLVHLQLFLEVLDSYLYLFSVGCASIEPRYINGLLELIKTHLDNLGPDVNPGRGSEQSGSPSMVKDQLQRCLDHIHALRNNPPPYAAQAPFSELNPEVVGTF